MQGVSNHPPRRMKTKSPAYVCIKNIELKKHIKLLCLSRLSCALYPHEFVYNKIHNYTQNVAPTRRSRWNYWFFVLQHSLRIRTVKHCQLSQTTNSYKRQPLDSYNEEHKRLFSITPIEDFGLFLDDWNDQIKWYLWN